MKAHYELEACVSTTNGTSSTSDTSDPGCFKISIVDHSSSRLLRARVATSMLRNMDLPVINSTRADGRTLDMLRLNHITRYATGSSLTQKSLAMMGVARSGIRKLLDLQSEAIGHA